MYPQTSVLRSGNHQRTTSAESALARIVHKIMYHCSGYFLPFLAALRESRRREASRIIRRYRHLLYESEK